MNRWICEAAIVSIASLLVAAATVTFAVSSQAAESVRARVEVLDKRFDVAGGMLAYSEFELSGEPLAAALGLDLDMLDPNLLAQPTGFDYAAGIESYEYSEEAMYALVFQSRLGPHLANGSVNAARGGKPVDLGKRMLELAKSTGFPAEELPIGLYPLSLPYAAGMPEFERAVDTSVVNGDEIELIDARGQRRELSTHLPAYLRDFTSLAWQEEGVTREFVPAAIGATLLKEVLWAQDFLGGMHRIADGREVVPTSSSMDRDGVYALGVSAPDGVAGAILTEQAWDKLRILRERLLFDGSTLGAKIAPQAGAASSPRWFPHRVGVDETTVEGLRAIGSLEVADARSTLRDTWLLLWPVSEFYAFADQRAANQTQNPAFLALFDGAPFPAAPAENTDGDAGNDLAAGDPFSTASELAALLFRNLHELHFDAEAGTFVDDRVGESGAHITTYDAAYAIAALSVFQRAADALPVGYASAGSSGGLGSARGARALELIEAQADFMIGELIAPDGLAADGLTLGAERDAGRSLATQFACLRGLSRAFVSTGNEKYRAAARKLYRAVEAQMFDAAIGTYSEQPGKPTEHTPWTAAAISGGLRELLLHLANDESEDVAELERGHLAARYTQWFRTIVNGARVGEGMQLAEWLGDSGEHVASSDDVADLDADGVAKITAAGGEFGTAMTLAARVRVTQAVVPQSAGE
jgi:hypothetical protein